jgi:uncharacterized BrkB/YihY/UPF0761 family membrane protein
MLLFECMMHYSYDVMAALAFGKPMGFIKGEQNDVAQNVLDIMAGSLSLYGLLQHIPWVMQMLTSLGSLGGPLKEWKDWSISQMKIRMAVSVSSLYTAVQSLTITRKKTQSQTWYHAS